MTREEAIKSLVNTKMYVQGKSKEIQEKLFSLGFQWTSGSKQVLSEEKPFLFLCEDMDICCSNDMSYFTKKLFREITAADILSIIIDEPKYRPFKDAKECFEEMQKHEPLGWLKHKQFGCYMCINMVYPKGVCFGSPLQYKYHEVFNKYTFIDGEPFGIKEN